MALFHCEDCGHEVSSRATSCPHCGCPVPTAEGGAGAPESQPISQGEEAKAAAANKLRPPSRSPRRWALLLVLLGSTAIALAAVLVGPSRLGLFRRILGGSAEPSQELQGVRQSAKAISAAIGVGVALPRFEDLVQEFAKQLLLVDGNKATSDNDRVLLSHYAKALEIYQDSLVLWREKVKQVQYDWIPAGTIGIEPYMAAIVVRYGLVTSDHTHRSDNSKYSTIDEESIQKLWQRADEHMAAADDIWHGTSADRGA